jgi:hypothetical protein
MNSLNDVIRFQGKRFPELTDEREMKMVLDLAEKLSPLEKEILAHPGGVITIRRTGALIIDSFPPELVKKIRDLS